MKKRKRSLDDYFKDMSVPAWKRAVSAAIFTFSTMLLLIVVGFQLDVDIGIEFVSIFLIILPLGAASGIYNRDKRMRQKSNQSKWSVPFSRIPHGITPKERAGELLSSANWHTGEINQSGDVFDFVYSYDQLVSTINELIWLNERKKVFMHPTPRSELNKIQSNMPNTINAFIDRVLLKIKFDDFDSQKRADKIEKFIDSMQEDDDFFGLMVASGCDRISQLRSDAGEIRAKDSLSNIGIKPNRDCTSIDAMQVILAMERNLGALYGNFLNHGFPPHEGQRILDNFKSACISSNLPLAAEVRLDALLVEYEPKFCNENQLFAIDSMDGNAFEHWCAGLLSDSGFLNVEVTKSSGDHGVDVLATKDGIKYAFQCKCYSSDLGNKPVQEVHAGKSMYQCHVGVVMTNRHFTTGAKELARATSVLLWDRDKVKSMIEAAGRI